MAKVDLEARKTRIAELRKKDPSLSNNAALAAVLVEEGQSPEAAAASATGTPGGARKHRPSEPSRGG